MFVFTCIQSVLETQGAYLSYFVCCYVFNVAAWLLVMAKFKFNKLKESAAD